ncbi:AraC family transcriptional regulator [uncultured Blautia sp.]|uniref:AraC family transcriptional regulator n=1 Tax=uncultured Blautia sp. TaxID=765821 RepID=UPI00280ADFD6|nr:AraC family transcriptional regulator [uncultured Blautia sp.]
MQQALLDHLKIITEEEQRILDGMAEVDKGIYTSGQDFIVDSAKMLQEGKLIAVRTHTRFVHFPSHRHNFIEVLYVCEGAVTNIIGDKKVVIRKGELLFLNQFTRHEILPARKDDIVINFMVLPEFFDVAYTMAGNNNVLADFLVNVLRQDQERGEYLHFRVAEVLQIQNLLENMIYSLVTGKGDQNRINQTTMGLIFLYLLDSVQYVEMRVPNQYENMIAMTTLDYIEQRYRNASLTELCEHLHLPMHVLSKMIKKNTGFNFKELLQRKRLNKAVELMCETDLPVSDVIAAVGYENGSYFHRVFRERYHMTPKAFREANRKNDKIRLK